jgi:hypothetical protein
MLQYERRYLNPRKTASGTRTFPLIYVFNRGRVVFLQFRLRRAQHRRILRTDTSVARGATTFYDDLLRGHRPGRYDEFTSPRSPSILLEHDPRSPRGRCWMLWVSLTGSFVKCAASDRVQFGIRERAEVLREFPACC